MPAAIPPFLCAERARSPISAGDIIVEGGALAVNFQSDIEGVHEAYIELSSPEAATVFIPMSVLCQTAQGIEDINAGKIVSGTRKMMEWRDTERRRYESSIITNQSIEKAPFGVLFL